MRPPRRFRGSAGFLSLCARDRRLLARNTYRHPSEPRNLPTRSRPVLPAGWDDEERPAERVTEAGARGFDPTAGAAACPADLGHAAGELLLRVGLLDGA